MMFWPSMMSLAPPPVTPSRKFPPRLGWPAACVELVDGDELPLLPQAPRLPVRAPPAPPAKTSRRKRSAISEPLLFVGAGAARGPVGQVRMQGASLASRDVDRFLVLCERACQRTGECWVCAVMGLSQAASSCREPDLPAGTLDTNLRPAPTGSRWYQNVHIVNSPWRSRWRARRRSSSRAR